jgi:iron complex outermembrane recepter protein
MYCHLLDLPSWIGRSTIFIVLAGAASGLVFAEEPPAPAEELETIVITGSNIRGSDIQAALPIQIIDRGEIDRSGARTAEQVLQRISANLIGATTATSIGGGSPPGMASANLRGMGSGSTLILINGHRAANYAFDGAAVDLNSIPLAAVERVEILKDGASAIYGGDAMAGVINFILRPDYAGAQLWARLAETQHGGGNQQQYTASFGHGNLERDGYNAFVTVDWQDSQELRAAARPYSRTGYLPDQGVNALSVSTFPANIFDPVNYVVVNPSYAAGCAPPVSLRNPLPDPGFSACGFDYLSVIDSLPPTQQLASVAGATLRLSADSQLYGEVVYAQNQSTLRLAPTPASFVATFAGAPVLYPANGPYYPTTFASQQGLSGDLSLLYRTIPLGPRTQQVHTQSVLGIAGVEGHTRGWDYDLALTYSWNHEHDDFTSGYVSERKFLPAMYSGLINPFGPSTPAGLALLASTQETAQHNGSGTTGSIEARFSRTLRELPHGRMALATGLELRHEELSNRYSPEFNTGDLLAESGNFLNTTSPRDVAGAYAELNVPVAAHAEAQLAARYDHYSDFGSSVNPKVALRWEPVDGLLFRTSWGTGFRPPTLYDLHTPVTSSEDLFLDVSDPLRCPITQQAQDCSPSFSQQGGGNRELSPEKSQQFNAGILWSKLKYLSSGADYWKLHKSGNIGALTPETILGNYGAYGHYVTRGPVDPAYPNLPGPIISVDTRNQNLGGLNTAGIDVNLTLRSGLTVAGHFSLRLDGTYVTQWEEQLDGLHYVSGLGRNIEPVAVGAVPRWRHYLACDWDFRKWQLTLTQNYSAGYTDTNLTPANTERHVAAYGIWDLQATYVGFHGAKLSAGVNNLLDTEPSFSNQTRYSAVGYNPRYGDPLGRVFYASLSYDLR